MSILKSRRRAGLRARPQLGLLCVTAVGLGLTALTACGGQSAHRSHAASTGAAGGVTAAGQPSCGLAPASLVNSALGTDVGKQVHKSIGIATVCQFAGAKAGQVIVRFQTGEDAATFAAERKQFDANGQPTANVAGFTDGAFSSTLNTLGVAYNTLVARDGAIEILVSSKAGLDAEKALERQLFRRL